MYAHCIYCVAALRTNTDVDGFPVGRQLAFDDARGRLWVVCSQCGRWNLSPLETRWDAIETCARLYARTAQRAGSAHIGLARLASGVQLIRVGAPAHEEFAAWRYGRTFATRRRRAYATAATLAVVAAGTLALQHASPASYAALPMAALLPHVGSLLGLYRTTMRPIARLTGGDGRATVVRGTSVSRLRLVTDVDAPGGWMLQVPSGGPAARLTGDAATRVLARVLAHTNHVGGGDPMVRDAVHALAQRGTGSAFLRDYATRHGGVVADPMHSRVTAEWLALEMALHEDAERKALDGDLAALEIAWQEAEALAAIADNLLTPTSVLERVQRWREPRWREERTPRVERVLDG